MSTSVEIGYLCARGHYCFHADPNETGQCGSKSVGTITLTFDSDLGDLDQDELLAEASTSLRSVYETWRTCECSGGDS